MTKEKRRYNSDPGASEDKTNLLRKEGERPQSEKDRKQV